MTSLYPLSFRKNPSKALMLALLFTLSACGGGGGSSGDNSSSSIQAESSIPALRQPLGSLDKQCQLELSTTTVAPGEGIYLNSSLPGNMHNPGIRLLAKNTEGKYYASPAFFSETPIGNEALEENPRIGLYAPAHPLTPYQGGEVLLEVGDGSRYCKAVALTLEPLPETQRPDFFLEVIDQLEAWVEQHIRLLGADFTDSNWHETFDSNGNTPANILLLKHAQDLLATPEGFLRQQATQLSLEQKTMISSLLESTGFLYDLENDVQDLADLTPVSLAGTAPPISPLLLSSAVAPQAFIASSSVCDDLSISMQLDINNALDLSVAMLDARKGNPTSHASFEAAGHIGTVISARGGDVGDAMGHLGNILSVVKTVSEARQALLPSRITEFRVFPPAADHRNLVEDRNTAAHWNDATVTAAGNPIGIEALTFEFTMMALGSIPGPVGTGISLGSIPLNDQLNSIKNTLSTQSCARIEAPTYGPFDVAEQEWVKSEIVGSAIVKTPAGSLSFYKPAEIGEASVKVTLRGEKFGVGENNYSDSFDVDVRPMQINTNPLVSVISLDEDDLGTDVEIRSWIGNSQYEPDGSNKVSASLSTGPHTLSSVVNDEDRLITVHTSTDPDDYPVHVTISPTQPLLPGGVSRDRVIIINTGGAVALSSEVGCVKPGDEFTVTADFSGLSNGESLLWDVTGGTLVNQTPTGNQAIATISAGGAGNMTVSVRFSNRPDIQDSMDFGVATSCLKKIIYPLVISRLTGNGDDGAGDDCGGNSDVERQDYEVRETDNIPDPFVMPPESALWYNTSLTFKNSFTSDFTKFKQEGDDCLSVNVSGNAAIDTRYFAANDGTIGMESHFNLQGNCADNGPLYECAHSYAAASAIAYHIIPVSQQTRVTLEGEYSCDNLSGDNIMGGNEFSQLMVFAFRQVGGSGDPDPEFGGQPTPILWSAACTPDNRSHTLSRRTLTFAAPQAQGTTDLVLIQTSLGAITGAVTGHRPGILYSDFIPQGEETGNFTARGDVNFRLKVSEQ